MTPRQVTPRQVTKVSETTPLSLYVHIPWCIKKCPYCDFNSHEQTDPPWDEYIDALLDDLVRESTHCAGRSVETIFFGGGTPSLMPGDKFRRLMQGISERAPIAAAAEITLEANPGTVDADNFEAYWQAGVNRLSIGAQSFRNKQLESLGRVHRVDAIMKTVLIARSIGFENLNIDIMHSLPNDDEQGCLMDIRQAIKLSTPHISWYELTLEEGTAFARKPPFRPLHEEIINAHEHGVSLLAVEEFSSYEVSAYAKPGFVCRHNLNYWQFGDYIGIGAGAHGKVSEPDGIFRTEKRLNPNSYLKGVKSDDHSMPRRKLTNNDLVTDFVLNAFRLTDGFDETLFESRTGLDIRAIKEPLQRAEDKQLIIRRAGRISPTALGSRFLNDLLLLFCD